MGLNRYGYQTAENNRRESERQVLPNGDIRTTTTTPSGAQRIRTRSADELTRSTTAYGVTATVNKVLDEQTLRPIPNQVTVTTPGGLTSTTTLTKTYAEDGADTSAYTFTVERNGRLSTIDVNGRTGLTRHTSAEGRSASVHRNPETLLTELTQVPGLLDTHYEYDQRGRLVETRTGERSTGYGYDPLTGHLTEITAADNRTTEFEYDLLGRVTRIIYPDGRSTLTEYDANGNATTVTVPTPAEHSFGINAVNLVESIVRPLSQATQYTYNRDRQLTGIRLPSGEQIQYVYQDGTLVRTERPEGNTHYRYQQGDQLAEVQEGSEQALYRYDGTLLTRLRYQGQLSADIDYGYNSDFQVNSLSYAGASTGIDYDQDGLVTTLHGYSLDYHPDHGLPQQLSRSQWSQTRQWTAHGEAQSVSYRQGTQTRYAYDLDYNTIGQITRKTEQQPDGSSVTYDYDYDIRNRLTQVRENGQVTESYAYNANGNRISHTSTALGIHNETASYTLGDQLQSRGDTTYQYDANGRLSGKLVETDDGLHLTTYQYDTQGRLMQVDTPEQSISYRHNALGNRVAKLIDGQVTEHYLWQDLTTLLATYDASGNLKQRFEYTLGHTPTSFTQNGQRYFIQTDHLGSPRVITDSSGNVVKSIRYDSYGNITADSNPGFAIPFGFAGGLYDSDTQLIRFGYRDYDPETGRWTARDPIGFAGGDTNLYGYVLGDPVNWIDPKGLSTAAVHRWRWPIRIAGAGLIAVPFPGTELTGLAIIAVTIPGSTPQEMESRSRGQSDPITVEPFDPGRDCEGNCNPCPPNQMWPVEGPGHGHPGGVWHTIEWHQNPDTCWCFPDRPSQGLMGW